MRLCSLFFFRLSRARLLVHQEHRIVVTGMRGSLRGRVIGGDKR